MIVQVYDWVKQCSKKLEEIGLPHESVYDVDEAGMWEIAKKIHDAGLNVMILQHRDSPLSITIGVDTGRFTQR